MTQRTPITLEGYGRLQEILDRLINEERPKAARAIGRAREHGDLAENAEYHAAKDAQGILEARIRQMESQLAIADVIDLKTLKSDKILFGATVKVVDLETDMEESFQIVGELEADLEKGRISIKSPIARGLIGKTAGDLVDIEVPGRTRCLEVLEISYN